jgi:hypothetical protein
MLFTVLCMEEPYPASGCSAASFLQSCCWYITKCTQNADITEIKQGRQGRLVQCDSSLITSQWLINDLLLKERERMRLST